MITSTPQVTEPLRRLIDEARAEVPRIDWERVEAGLFDERGAVRAGRQGRRSGVVQAITAFAIAASFVAAVAAPRLSLSTPRPQAAAGARAPVVVTESLAMEPRLIEPGTTLSIESGRSVALDSAGRLHGRVRGRVQIRLLDAGERIHLELTSGVLAAEVVPVAGGEPLAIDVAGRRVAVHGTRLAVAATSEGLEVAVAEGSAVVGWPRGEGRTEGVLVPAGGIGRFSSTLGRVWHAKAEAERRVASALAAEDAPAEAFEAAGSGTSAAASSTTPRGHESDLASGGGAHRVGPSVVGDAPTDAVVAPRKASGPAAPRSPGNARVGGSGPTSSVAGASAAEQPPASDPARSLDDAEIDPTFARIAGAARACFPRGSAETKATFETTITMRVRTDGTIDGFSFDPPLHPAREVCVRNAIGHISFPHATLPSVIQRRVSIGQ